MAEKKRPNIVLLTGATGGLGKLLAKSFFEAGYQVIGTDIYEKEIVQDELKGYLTDFFTFDLNNLKEIPAFIRAVCQKHDIDVLVNNAGILDFRFLEEYTEDEVIRTVNVNLISIMLLIKSLVPYFEKKKYGRIINISSNSAYRGFETGSLYTPTKAGINLLTESFGNELEILGQKSGFDITVNAVCPSRVETEEYLEGNPDVKRRSLISGKKIFREIDRFIHNKKNGQIVHLFSSKYKMHFIKQVLFNESIRILFK